MNTSQLVELLQQRQIAVAGKTLASAFFDDPLMVYVEPDAARRRRWLAWFFELPCRDAFHHGEAYAAGDADGVACWRYSDQTGTHLRQLVRAGAQWMPFRMGLGAFSRFSGIMSLLEKLHDEAVPPEHWYLMALGVAPACQGRGLGGALIQPVLGKADATGWPCYLETTKPENVRFYERYGFEVVRSGDLPRGGPRFWTMRRPPRRSS